MGETPQYGIQQHDADGDNEAGGNSWFNDHITAP